MSFQIVTSPEQWQHYARMAGSGYRPRRPNPIHRHMRRQVVLMYASFLFAFTGLMLLISLTRPASIPPLSHSLPAQS